MKKYIYPFLFMAMFLFNGMSLGAVNYGNYNLFAHFDFENGATDLMGNVEATTSNLSYEYDAELGMNVMKFEGSNKGNLKLDTYPLSKQMTISLWFNRQDLDESACWQMIFAWYAPDGSNIFLTPRTNWGPEVYLIADNRAYTDYKSVAMKSISLNTWSHYAIVFDESEVLAYQDGELVGTGRIIGDVTAFGTTKHYFGNFPENNYKMTGKIGDVRIYHSVLAANQISALANKEEVPEPGEVDPNQPFAQISFDNGVTDTKGELTLKTNVECTKSVDMRSVGRFKSNSYISTTDNPIGDDKYSVAFLYRTEEITDQMGDKTVFKFTADNGDYVALFTRYVDGNLVLEAERSESGTVKKTGVTTTALNAATWNSFAFCQTYNSAGTGACRLYVNGALVRTGLSFKTNNLEINKWTIGDEQGNALTGDYADIRFYKRELTPEDVLTYHNGNTSAINLVVYPNDEKQTIRNFGASDGWNGQTVGLYFSETQKEEIAELLFSKELDSDGNPKGIGLSSWRFNIGAGTSEQGAASRISDETRRTECFLNSDMTTYDWSKQAGQRALLELAVKKYDVPDIIGWQNSPPVMFTKRGLGFREYGDEKSTILKSEHYADFGNFLASVIEHFEQEGIHFDYLSPLNEPQYDWTCDATTKLAKQEGSPWSNQEIHDVVTAINNAFVERDIDTKIFISEAGAISYHLSASSGFASQQLSTFWGNGELSLAGLPAMSNIVSSHSYWTDGSAQAIVDNRASLRDEMEAINSDLEYWQTEYSLLGTGYAFGHSTSARSPIQCAISLARIIHADLAIANATGWQWWTTFELEKNIGTEERFALIRIALNESKSAGVYNETKLLYALGNFSFFIRPGMKRIELERSDEMNDYDAVTNQMFSAYKDEATGRIVVVAINASTSDCGISLPEVPFGEGKSVSKYVPYITSGEDGDNMKRYPEVSAGQHYVMPGYSIVTFVGDPEPVSSVEPIMQECNVLVYPNPVIDYVKVQSPFIVDQYSLFDLSGKLLMASDVNNHEFDVNVSTLSKGLYLLRLKGDTGVVTKRIIVDK